MQSDTDRPRLDAETRVRLLLEVSRSVRGTLALDEMLQRLLHAAGHVVAFDAGGIFVLREGLAPGKGGGAGPLIAGFARRGYDPNPQGRDPMLNDGAGITGHVIRTGDVVCVPDVRNEPRYIEGRAGTRSEIALPIARSGRVIGALNLESDRLDAFACVDVETLEFFADAAGIAIENAVLHERLVEGERFEAQMRLAQEVQARLLPTQPPVVRGYDLAGRCIPTLRIGGDYYDAVTGSDGRLTLVVADVAGKGVAAALVMAAFRALLRGCIESGGSLGEVVAKLNRALPDSLAGVVFVTAFVARLDPASGEVAYVNCGHNPPFVSRDPAAGGEATGWLDVGGPVLGVFPEARFEVGTTRLAPGDVLVLYTDGVVESADPARTHFGAERLAVVASRLREKAAPEMIREIVLLTREFSGAVEYDDDFTIVALKRDDGRSSGS